MAKKDYMRIALKNDNFWNYMMKIASDCMDSMQYDGDTTLKSVLERELEENDECPYTEVKGAKRLWKKAKNGDYEAFDKLYERVYDVLLKDVTEEWLDGSDWPDIPRKKDIGYAARELAKWYGGDADEIEEEIRAAI